MTMWKAYSRWFALILAMTLCGCDSFRSFSGTPTIMHTNDIKTSEDTVRALIFTGDITLWVPLFYIQNNDQWDGYSFVLEKSTASGTRKHVALETLKTRISLNAHNLELTMPTSIVHKNLGEFPWSFSLYFSNETFSHEEQDFLLIVTFRDDRTNSISATITAVKKGLGAAIRQ